jgi:hypothetical protein
LSLQKEPCWDLVKQDNLKLIIKALSVPLKPAKIISYVSGIIDCYQPTTSELIETAILDEFTNTWQGYMLSFTRS